MKLKEITKKINYIYKGKILNLRCDDAILPNGNLCKREVIEHSGGAAVLYVNFKNEVLFVKQFRYCYNEELLEIPAGKLNKDEEPIFAAKRELKEETGLIADVSLIGIFYPTPGYTNEKLYIYKANSVEIGEAKLDSDEFLNIEYISLDKVKEMLKNNEIKDCKTVIALNYYLLNLK